MCLQCTQTTTHTNTTDSALGKGRAKSNIIRINFPVLPLSWVPKMLKGFSTLE